VSLSVEEIVGQKTTEGKIYHKVCTECQGAFSFQHKSVKIKGSGKPNNCPLCGSPYWDKPMDEVRLFKLQDQYIESGRDSAVLEKMYAPLYQYAENTAKGLMRAKFILNSDRMHEVSHDATAQVIEKYLADPEFVIRSSFGGNFNRLLKGLLFGGRKHDKVASLDTLLSDNTETLEHYADSESSAFVNHHQDIMRDTPEMFEESLIQTNEMLVSDLMAIVDKITYIMRTEFADKSILFLAGLYGFFAKKNSASQNLFFTIFGNRVNNNIEDAKLFIREYLIKLGSIDDYLEALEKFKFFEEIEDFA